MTEKNRDALEKELWHEIDLRFKELQDDQEEFRGYSIPNSCMKFMIELVLDEGITLDSIFDDGIVENITKDEITLDIY